MAENTQAGTSGSGNQPAGKAVILYGSVKAIATDGTERVLAPNSPIFMGDHIITGPDGMVSIIFDADGTQLDLGRMSDAFIDDDVAGGVPAETVKEITAQVADIQAALEKGDLSQIGELPAPAAGAGVTGGHGGNAYPVFTADNDAVLPGFGLETTGITYTTLNPEGGGIVEEEQPPVPVQETGAEIPLPPSPPYFPPPIPPPPTPTEVPPTGQGSSLVVDEAQIVDSDSLPNLTFTAGSDPLVSFAFSNDLSGLLTDTDGIPGDDVTWVRVSDTVIQGIVDGQVALTLTLNAPGTIDAWNTGTVTVTATLTDAFQHPAGGGSQTLDLGSIGVIATELDGGSVEAPVFIAVVDDVPTISLSPESGAVEEEALDDTVNLSGGNPDDAGAYDTAADNAVVSGVIAITSDYGADGPGAITFAINGDLSTLPALYSQGDLVTYSVTGDTLTASADGRTVFTLQVDADSGIYTFILNDQLDNTYGDDIEGKLDINFSSIVTATITDEEGDTATAVLDSFIISVEDDVPVLDIAPAIDATVTATVLEDGLSYGGDPGDPDQSEGNRESGETVDDDETSDLDGGNLLSLFATSFAVGADEHPVEDEYMPTVTVGLSTDISGLTTLYSQGEALTYTVTQGATADTLTATSSTGTVFTLVVYHDGSWTFDLDDQLDHVAPVDPVLAEENTALVTDGGSVDAIDFSSILVGTIIGVDYDGDGATSTATAAEGSFVVAVEDDVPVIGDPQDAILANEAGNSLVGDLDIDFGTDEPGDMSLTPIYDGTAVVAGDTVYDNDGNAITINDGEELTWVQNADGSWSAVSEDEVVAFTVSLEQDSDGYTGNYTVDLLAELDGEFVTSETTISVDDLKDKGRPDPDDPSGNYAETVSVEKDDIIITFTADNPDDEGPGEDTVKWASNQGISVGNGFIDEDPEGTEQLIITFTDSDGDPLEVTSLTVLLDHLDQHQDQWNSDPEVATLTFYRDGETDPVGTVDVTGSLEGSTWQADKTITVVVSDDPVPDPDPDITYYYIGESFDQVIFTADTRTDDSGNSEGYRINDLVITYVEEEPLDHTLTFLVDGTDYDGDAFDQADFNVTFDGNGDIVGTDADEVIAGSSGDDVIHGGDGDDVIYGGDGDDTIYGEDGDDVIDGGPGADVIDGGDGDDTISYAGDTEGVDVNLSDANPESGGQAEGDAISDVENIEGGTGDDVLTGDDGSNVLEGGAGEDELYGGGGNDALDGGPDADVLVGGDGDDVLLGGEDDAAADEITGGAGDDTFDADEVDGGEATDFDTNGVDDVDQLVPPVEPDSTV